MYFSRNSPKGHIKARKAGEGRKGAPLVFFLAPAILNLRSQSFPQVFVFLVRLSHYFIFFPPFFLIHRTHSSHPLVLSLSPAALGLPPVSSRDFFHSPRRVLSPPLFRFVLLVYRLRFRVFDYLVYSSKVFFSSFFIRFCFSFDHCPKAQVILDVRN